MRPRTEQSATSRAALPGRITRWIGFLAGCRRSSSVVVGVAAFVVAYMFLFPTGCADVEGMSSWERCTTLVGDPAFSLSGWGLANQFDILIPLAVAVLAALVTWWLLGSRRPAEAQRQSDATIDG